MEKCKFLAPIKWERNKQCVCLVYADSVSDLVTEFPDGLKCSDGSLAYTGDGKACTLVNGTWVER